MEIDDGEVWTDLPRFGWVARDCWNFGTLTGTLCPRNRARAGVGTGVEGVQRRPVEGLEGRVEGGSGRGFRRGERAGSGGGREDGEAVIIREL